MVGALRAACDEMGVVLVRSAHSANIKERRDASTGLFDAGGQMVMQAEHIPVHLGAMPAAVAAVLDEEQRPGEAWVLNDPYRGGTHLPDITVITPDLRRRRAHRLRSEPRAPRRRRRTRAGQHAGGLAHARRGGRGDRAPAARRRRDRGTGGADAQPPPARGRPARAARREPRRGGARWRSWSSARGSTPSARRCDETLDYAERRTRAAIAELEDGEREASDVLEARDGDLELQAARDRRRATRSRSTSRAPPSSTTAT